MSFINHKSIADIIKQKIIEANPQPNDKSDPIPDLQDDVLPIIPDIPYSIFGGGFDDFNKIRDSALDKKKQDRKDAAKYNFDNKEGFAFGDGWESTMDDLGLKYIKINKMVRIISTVIAGKFLGVYLTGSQNKIDIINIMANVGAAIITADHPLSLIATTTSSYGLDYIRGEGNITLTLLQQSIIVLLTYGYNRVIGPDMWLSLSDMY